MFDPQTTSLIRAAPELPDLDRDRLPEELTRAFAAIVAFRVQLGGNTGLPPDDLRAKLEEFRRMAATFEGMVALLPELETRRSAAFVAAQAYHLLILARKMTSPVTEPESVLRWDAISPTVSALLLFLIANQPSDAMEMARLLPQRAAQDNSISALVTDALIALAAGRLVDISALAALRAESLPDDYCEAAVEVLYGRVLEGLGQLAAFLRDARNQVEAGVTATTIFREVQDLAAFETAWPVIESDDSLLPAISTFPGPHHLATLLLAAADFLGSSALSAIEPPPGIPPARWNALLKTLVEQRPFLWPNHLRALSEEFLHPGTSSVISFPTGAGKTTLSILKTLAALAAGGAVIYLAPTHALVSQMKKDLREAFPAEIPVRESLLVEDFYAEVGESFAATGAQIVVMTPERCLALLSMGGEKFESVRLVIFDECHLLHPRGGGQNRRSMDAMLAILHLHAAAPETDWLLLSAMIKNVDELSGWLSELTGRKCLSLNLNWKPTRQARGCLVYDQTEIDTVKKKLTLLEIEARKNQLKLKAPGVAIKRQLAAHPYGFFCLQQNWQSREVRNYTLLSLLHASVPLTASLSPDQNNPRWYLAPNKNEVAADLAAQCVKIGLRVLLFLQNTGHVGSVAKDISDKAGDANIKLTGAESDLLRVATEEMGHLASVITAEGVAGCHHANMLPAERELTESLFKRAGGLLALAATPTLAQGMNLPADIVFIVGDERFDRESGKSKKLEAHELLNAAGRAGRAGHVAQGLVVVLPHTLVAFDPDKRKIGRGWTELQTLFSSDDQCLVVDDPIRHLIDQVQVATTEEDADVRYFIRRLPRGEPTCRAFLTSTFGAWRAKKAKEEAQFQELIDKTLKRREELAPQAATETWREDLAFRTGIAVELIQALDDELTVKAQNPPETTEAWVRWFFGWLGSNPKWLDALFGHRLSPELRTELNQGDLFGGKLAEIVWAWMSGETLRSLNTRVGGNAKNPALCPKARKFVLKFIPELAFAAGLATRIRRKQLEEADEKGMPLTLATLGLCVRDGLPEPEVAALKLVESRMESRQALITRWKRLGAFAAPRELDENFGRTRERVSAAISAAEEHGRG